ncbi:UPF0481 protein At3g47200-like [Syzygium oleosum]|uniref:UPF0481 protein At3g47200-like n=1 Tax=Syzygium oleosum TaxID=219896 RepID=UPI0024B9E9A2|nr:UPF0481 protein At3g47200-like [Syzygium oleosum]
MRTDSRQRQRNKDRPISSQEMAAVDNKELLGWYVITLQLRETVESRLPKESTYGGNIVPDYEPRPPESEWVVSIDEKLDQGRQENLPGSWANLSIYRFPHYLKDGNDKDWVPQIVSLGPYHHGAEHLRHMERHKWRCLHRILERSHQAIGRYLDSVKKVEVRARACYEGKISMSSDEFVEMMVLDGCFMIELFQGFAEGFEKLGYPRNDPVFSMRRSMLEIQRDMILLENQIPLFVLDRLLGLQLGGPNQKGRVAKLAIPFFDPLLPKKFFDPPLPERFLALDSSRRLQFDPLCNHGRVHCLEVFRRNHLLLDPKRSKTKKWSQRRGHLTCCLTELREAGIKIEDRFPNSCWDIQLKDGILRIPQFEIHEGTRSLFLNLIAFEQSQFDCSKHVTLYVIFMHNLINSPEDVRYLRHRFIIDHCLGSDTEVADLFNRLCQGVAFDINDSYLRDVSRDVDIYSQWKHYSEDMSWRVSLVKKWNSWRAILKNKYFDNPWSIISFIAAFVLLVLTFIQSLYAVYGYYRSRS